MQSLFAGWLIALELSASLYNLVWRGSLPQLRNQPLYDHTRNLILALLAVLKIAWLFGLIYWWEYNDQFANGGLRNVWEAIYFSFVTTTTVGFGDVQPMVTGGWLKLVVVLQIIVSAVMMLMILALAMNSVSSSKSLSDGPGS